MGLGWPPPPAHGGRGIGLVCGGAEQRVGGKPGVRGDHTTQHRQGNTLRKQRRRAMERGQERMRLSKVAAQEKHVQMDGHMSVMDHDP